MLRIPQSVLEKYVGCPVTVPEPKKVPLKRRGWLRRAAEGVARAALNNTEDATSRKLFERIAREARVLCFVPPSDWPGVGEIAGPEFERELFGAVGLEPLPEDQQDFLHEENEEE